MIIGITGTYGAGKGTIASYLVKKKGFVHFSVSDYLTKEIKKRKMVINRDSMITLANDLREKFGPDYLAVTLYKQAKATKKNSVIESLRTVGEIETLRKRGEFYLFAVDADPKIRFQRIQKRAGSKDRVSFKKFMESEKNEMETKDPTKQNLKKCIAMSDFKFKNNSNIKNLTQQVEKVLSTINQ